MQQFSSQPTRAGYAAFNFAQLLRRAHIALISLVFACVAVLSPGNAIAAHTSIFCLAKTGTVANGGTVTINVTDCDPFGGAGFNAPADGPLLPANGAAILRVRQTSPGVTYAWFLDYTHNGNSATTDAFEFTDSSGTGGGMETVRVTITITPPTSTIVVFPASLPTLTAGTAFSQTLTSTGGTAAYTYTLSTGALPIGLSLTAGGVLSGIPSQRGSYTFGVRSLDALGAFVVKGYSGSVQNPSITLSPNTFTLVQSAATSFSLASIGGVTPHSYQTEPFPGTAPAPGLTMSSAGLISGTPTALGSTTTSIRVTDASTPTASAYFELESLTLNVVAAPSVSIAVSPASVAEDGGTNLTYTVTRSANLSVPTTVNISTGGTASAGSDYAGGVATVVIPANATNATITINPNVDSTVEVNETVILTVAAGTGYTVGAPASATGTILNDDEPSASITVAPASVTEDGTQNLIYTVTLSQASLIATSVNFTVAGTATSGSDYAAVTSPLSIPANTTTGTITINPSTDTGLEPNETVILTIVMGTGYTVAAPASATGTINDDDVPTASIAVAPASVLEDGTTNLIYTVTLSQPNPGAATTVNYSIGGTASNGTDYAAITSPLVIATNATSGTITVNPATDIAIENNETVLLTLAAGTGYTVAASPNNAATGNISNDDVATASIAVAPASVLEDGTTNLIYTVTLSQPNPVAATTLNYSIAGTASNGTDYATITSPMVIPTNASSGTITVDPSADAVTESDETVILTLAVGTGYIVAASPNNAASATIVADECPSNIVTNGNDSGAGSLRQIIADACVGSTITFQAGVSTLTLTSAEIAINKNLAIDGGTSLVTVTRSSAVGTPDFRIFNVPGSALVSMSRLTISNGRDGDGGGLRNLGTLRLNQCAVSGNTSTGTGGGGVFNQGVLEVIDSTLSNNSAAFIGGGLWNSALGRPSAPSATFMNSTLTGNTAGAGAGIHNNGGALQMTNCTFSGNTASLADPTGGGGGLENTAQFFATTATLTNCTFDGNRHTSSADPTADDIYAGNFGTQSTVRLVNTLLNGSAATATPTLRVYEGGVITSLGNNLSRENSSVFLDQVSDQNSANALLAPLASYGGPTQTHALLPGSAAINGGSSCVLTANGCGNGNPAQTTDQRGIARVGAVDIGAFESRGFTMALSSGNSQTALVSTAFANPLVATLTSATPIEPVQGGRVNFVPPGAGASAAIATSPATIDASGVASVTATANSTVGSYSVLASSNGSTGASFALQNRLASADLSITKTDGVTSAVPGGSVTYTITAANAGPDATTATVADTFPEALSCSWICVGAGGGTCAAAGAGNINQSVGLPPGGSVSYTASCTISASATGSLSNTATVVGAIGDSDPANNSATDTDTLTPMADLSITKNDGVASVFAGGNTTYTIVASNSGPSNATGATVNDTFPASLTCTWTCVGASGGTCTATGAGNINNTVNLPSGGSVSYTASCAISAAASGTLSNTASVTEPGGVTDGTPGNNSATDSDSITLLPTLAIDDVSISEGNSATSVLTFTVTRTGTAPGPVGFNFATADSSATTAGSDYVTASGTGTIPSGGATGSTTVRVTINGDAIFENNESFFVNLTAPANAVIADNQGIGTITNDDTAPILAINDVSIVEGNTGTQNLVFTVTRTGLTALPATFTAATANGTASAPSDYLAALVGSASIAAGGASGTTTLTATINGDAVVEANEGFSVVLSAPANATIATGTGTGTINNDDVAGVVLTQSLSSTDVTEGGATDSYTLYLTSQPNSNVSIGLNPGAQVSVGASPVVFTDANWNIEQTITVTAVDDAAVEGPHTGTISHLVVSPDPNYNGVTVGNVVANITDNDLPTLAINDVSIIEGNGGTQVMNFTVTRTGNTPFAVGFNFATADGTATLADSDYVTTNGNVIIPSGGATASTTVSVTINGEVTFENTESFFVNLTAPTNALISDAQGVGTITNDDTAPTLAINDVSVVEGNSGTQNMVFTVTRTGLTALPASFVATANDGTATEFSDYLKAIVGSTSIAAGGATGTTTLSVTINGDLMIEGNENFSVDLSAPLNASFADAQGIGTISNDDGEPTFTPAGPITRQQGSPAAIATLGIVSDLTDPANSLAVAIIADTTTGVATTGLANSNGTVTASLAASCTASAGSFSVRVTDSGGLTDTDTVQINLSANTPPSLAYGAANVSVGNSLTITPSTGLSDNGTVTTVSVQSSGTYTGGISVSTSGVISLNSATPAGSHTLLIRATDNCGANNDVSVALNVGQASTFKLITSNVSPSRFGEAVTFSVNLAGVDPSGNVEFFAGTTSLGTAALVASPSGGANLKLANLTTSTLPVGTSVITARYAGDVNNSASVSADLAQLVNSAGTRITLTPAANPAPAGTVSIAVLVAPEAPGGGVPQGSVTLTSGALGCTAPLTAGAGSCALNFASVGYQAISASYTPSGSNHSASIGGSAVVIVATPSSTDLRVRIGNGVSNIGDGQALSYLIVVDNIGTQAAVGRLQVPISADFAGASYTCISAALASCTTSGTGSIDQELSLAPGGVVIYRFNVTAPLTPERVITQTASITVKTPTTDSDATNNSAADIDPMGLLADGYEDAAVTE